MKAAIDLFVVSLSNKTTKILTVHQVEMLIDGWRSCEVEVVKVGDGKTEVFQLVVTRIEAGKDGIVVINPTFHIVGNTEVHLTRAADGDIVGLGQQLHVGISLQFAPDGFLGRSCEVERFALLLHYLEDAQTREIALAGGKGNLVVLAQEF